MGPRSIGSIKKKRRKKREGGRKEKNKLHSNECLAMIAVVGIVEINLEFNMIFVVFECREEVK